jgi:hypothetical protein
MNMPNDQTSQAFTPSEYEIRIKGRLDSSAAIWFEDLSLMIDEKVTPTQTIIRGHFVDQAALYGSISRARDLGLMLLSVRRLDETGNVKPKDTDNDIDNERGG